MYSWKCNDTQRDTENLVPVEIGSNIPMTLKTFIAGINKLAQHIFLDTLQRGVIVFAWCTKAVPRDIWESFSTGSSSQHY